MNAVQFAYLIANFFSSHESSCIEPRTRVPTVTCASMACVTEHHGTLVRYLKHTSGAAKMEVQILLLSAPKLLFSFLIRTHIL